MFNFGIKRVKTDGKNEGVNAYSWEARSPGEVKPPLEAEENRSTIAEPRLPIQSWRRSAPVVSRESTSTFTVYSQRLAGYLMLNGCKLLYIRVSPTTGWNNFYFENSPFLHEHMKNWLENKEKFIPHYN